MGVAHGGPFPGMQTPMREPGNARDGQVSRANPPRRGRQAVQWRVAEGGARRLAAEEVRGSGCRGACKRREGGGKVWQSRAVRWGQSRRALPRALGGVSKEPVQQSDLTAVLSLLPASVSPLRERSPSLALPGTGEVLLAFTAGSRSLSTGSPP
jgi:hypothetical protein